MYNIDHESRSAAHLADRGREIEAARLRRLARQARAHSRTERRMWQERVGYVRRMMRLVPSMATERPPDGPNEPCRCLPPRG